MSKDFTSLIDPIWLGNAQSLAEVHHKLRAYESRLLAGGYILDDDEEEDDDEEDGWENPRLFELQGNLAVITTSGSLTSSNSFLSWLMGGTTYGRIREAFIEAAQHPQVEHILHVIDSVGGAVNGVEDAGALIRQISSIKPVTAYTGGSMESAAYWLGAAGSKIYAAPTASVGSIGARVTLMNYYEAAKSEGVESHVITSASKKALGDPMVKWTAEAQRYWQNRVNALGETFILQMAAFRKKTPEEMQRLAADGATFLGREALQQGLVDGVMTLDMLVQKLQRTPPMVKLPKTPALTAQALAELAAGKPLETLIEPVPEASSETPPEVPPVAEEAPSIAAEAPSIAAEAPPVVTGTPAYPDLTQVVSHLKADIASKEEQLMSAKMEAKAANDKLLTMAATHKGLVTAVCSSINLHNIKLGRAPTDLSALDATQALAMYEQTAAEFATAFKVGAQAVPVTEPAVTGKQREINRDLLRLP